MTHYNKREADGPPHYRPCPESWELDNHIEFNGCCIRTLICMDVVHRCELSPCDHKRQVVSIPAAMSREDWFGGRWRRLARQPAAEAEWSSHYVIVANSRTSGCPSFIANTACQKIVQCYEDGRNRVILRTWAELDSIKVFPEAEPRISPQSAGKAPKDPRLPRVG